MQPSILDSIWTVCWHDGAVCQTICSAISSECVCCGPVSGAWSLRYFRYFTQLCWKISSEIAPTITFFRNFAPDLESQRVGLLNRHNERCYWNYLLFLNLAVYIAVKMIGSSTYIDCLYPTSNSGKYTQTVWGYCFIYCKGTPRPKNEIKQIQSSHLFCKLVVP